MKIVRLCAVVALGGMLAACGGNGSPGTGSATGKFIGTPVAGLAYEAGATKGVTGPGGTFTYTPGQEVTFRIGDISLGTAVGDAVITLISLAGPGASASDERVVAMVQLINALTDVDGLGNLVISETAHTQASGEKVDFSAPAPQVQVASSLGRMWGGSRRPMSAEAAAAHMRASIMAAAAGSYSGSWHAPRSVVTDGRFDIVMDTAGQMTGTATLGKTVLNVSSAMSTTLVSGSKFAVSGTVNNGATWTGTLDLSTGTLAGEADYDGVHATFSARKI